MAPRILFLPGAGGDGRFWRPVSERLDRPRERVLFDWPGFGETPPRGDVCGPDDLLRLVLEQIDRPVDLVAQSMGGVLALRAALARPGLIEHLVLAATSGGIDMGQFGSVDWRHEYLAELPHVPRWFVDDRTDLADRLTEVEAPTLLLFGDADPVAPVAAGAFLASRLRNARLEVVKGGDHAFAKDRPEEVAGLIAAHLDG